MKFAKKNGYLFLIGVIVNIMPIVLIAQSSAVKQKVPGTFNKLLNPKVKSLSGLEPVGLQQFYSATGQYTLSADGVGSISTSMTIRVDKPNAQATVEKAILISAVTSNIIYEGCVSLAGVPVNWDGSAAVSFFNNYWADVTSIVAPLINASPAGLSTLDITECNTNDIDGEALLVVFKDTAATEKTIIVMVGGQNPTGDNFSVTLADTIRNDAPGALLDMGLGIGYSYQSNGVNQASQVNVNQQRITSSAGGEDDGAGINGALITVGGIGDANTNPSNPFANPTNPRSDDELYSILPFLSTPTVSLNISTLNPSLDDNIFLAYFAIKGAAIIGEGILLSQDTSVGDVGTSHTVNAVVKDSLGNLIANRLVTFTVTAGPNAGHIFSTTTNSQGEASYTYIGTGGRGTDEIQACFTNGQNKVICSNTLSFQWVLSNDFYSKASGDLHDLLTWGVNMDGSGANPVDFGAGKTFHLVNRVTTYTMTASWTVEGTIDITAGSILKLNGFTLSEAGLMGTGKLFGSPTSNLVVTGASGGDAGPLSFSSGGRSLNSFTLDRMGDAASVSIISSLSIYDVLTVVNGALTTGNNLTLKSSAVNTARVAPVTGDISGSIIVERYIPARRAWRLLSAPVGGSQTIHSAWQEGATTASMNPDPKPGFGTHITGGPLYGSLANGFDQNPESNSSIKYYKSVADNWDSVPNTNVAVNAAAYMLFVRGNRGLALGDTSVAATNTILRAKGPLKIGNQTFSVSANGFTAVPNPYPSPIDFATITLNNVDSNFYLWDPKLGGTYGSGGYVLLSYNGSGYDVIPASVSPESQYIQSGQGFLVHAKMFSLPGSVVIKESDKTATPATNVFRQSNTNRTANSSTQGIRITLQQVNGVQAPSVLDEVLSSYSAKFSNQLDNMDALKPGNFNENLAIVSKGQNLTLERKGLLSINDTIQLKLWNINQNNYQLVFNPAGINATEFFATFTDNYLHTSMPLRLDTVTKIKIDNATLAAPIPNRFTVIISRKGAVSPLVSGGESMINCYPNPTSGKVINIQLSNQPQGMYEVELVNSTGQVAYKSRIKHAGGSTTETLHLNKIPAGGIYQLRVVKGTYRVSLPLVVNKN